MVQAERCRRRSYGQSRHARERAQSLVLMRRQGRATGSGTHKACWMICESCLASQAKPNQDPRFLTEDGRVES